MSNSILKIFFSFLFISTVGLANIALAEITPACNDERNSYNSTYRVIQETSQNVEAILIYVRKNNDAQYRDQFIARPSGTKTDVQVNFKGGDGDYQIQVLEKNAKTKNYKTIAKLDVKNHDKTDQEGLLASDFIQSTHPEIKALAKEITAGAKDQREAVIKINAWMVQNINYDSDGLRSGSYVYKDHDALSTLKSRSTVCEGFAHLFAALSRASGIKTRYITGRSDRNNAHAWNEVFLEGRWYNVDSTWDQSVGTSTFLFMNDEGFNQTHLKRELQGYK